MFQRIIAGLPAIGRVADAFVTINKPIKKGADYIVNYFISDASKGISKLDNVNDTTKLASVTEGIGDSGDITKSVVKEIKVVDDTADIAKASKNVEKMGDTTLDLTKSVVKEIKVVDDTADIAKASKNVEKMGDTTLDLTKSVINNQQGSKISISKNQQGAPIFKSNKEFIYGNYKKSYTIIRPMKGKIESIKELLTIEGQAKAQNMTMQEIYDLAKKEGLNVGELKKAGETGIGQKFDIVGNGKEKIEIKINGKKIKERNVLSIRSNSGGIHNSSYILIGTDDGKIKVIFGSPEKYEYNPTNTEKAELIFVEQPKSK